MDVRTFYQAQLFAPAFLFQTLLEAWGTLLEPRRAGEPAPHVPLPAQRIEPATALSQPVVRLSPLIPAGERSESRELELT